MPPTLLPSRCRPTRSTGHEALRRAGGRPGPTVTLTMHVARKLHSPSPPAQGNARCGKTPISSASPSWRWQCARAASWTNNGLVELGGHCHRGKQARRHTKSVPTVSRLGGSQSHIEHDAQRTSPTRVGLALSPRRRQSRRLDAVPAELVDFSVLRRPGAMRRPHLSKAPCVCGLLGSSTRTNQPYWFQIAGRRQDELPPRRPPPPLKPRELHTL